jgi:hypothetical protein
MERGFDSNVIEGIGGYASQYTLNPRLSGRGEPSANRVRADHSTLCFAQSGMATSYANCIRVPV